jgi:hypothetical protein
MKVDDPEVNRLLSEVIELTGESPAHALTVALQERLARLQRELAQARRTGALTRDQADELFGY